MNTASQLANRCIRMLCGCAVVGVLSHGNMCLGEISGPDDLRPGLEFEIPFSEASLPLTLYSMMRDKVVAPVLTVCLPEDYSPTNTYPLVVYVPGNDGNAKGNIFNAKAVAGSRGWIAATLPLFKKFIDRSEPVGGVIVGFEDYPVLSKAYREMLGKLFERVPNIDREKSAMVGFSNGAITIGVLVSNHDEFILTHFKSFCLVDHGMFHLADLHKSRARDCRFLILVGDQEGPGRELKLRQSRLLQDAWKMLNVDVTCRILENTGHEFNDPRMAIVREWLRNQSATAPKSLSNGRTN